MNRLSITRFAAACTTGLALAAGAAHAQTAQPMKPAPQTMQSASSASGETRLHQADQAFVADGTKAVSTQRDAARLATSRSTDRAVKAYAERVAADDAKLVASLRAASPRGVDVPANDPDTAVLDGIKDLRGAAFDKAYIEQVALAGSQQALSPFQAEIASGRNEQLKNAARKALPVLQAHYAEAQKLAARKHMQ